tara:strand:- start:635 stop:943 length:309 start_codon:yes stop_codon:yes gene_type:complete
MEKHDQLYFNLLLTWHQSAMSALGKINNPVTGKMERNLDQAQAMIDMLEMLHVKTKGNVSEEMEKTQNMMLSELRLNFVDEKDKEKNKPDSKEEKSNKKAKK